MYTNQLKLLEPTTAVSGTITGGSFAVGDRVKMSVQFISANSTGSAVFTIEVSNDDTNWVTYNRLTDNVVNSDVQTDTRVAASSALATATSKMYFFPEGDHFEYVRATVTITTGGSYSAILHTVI